MQFRQGDMFMERVDSLPDGYSPVGEPGKTVIGHGEVTGHLHAYDSHAQFAAPPGMSEQDLDKFARTGETTAEIYVLISQPTNLRHDEHAPIPHEPGIYRVTRQRVYTPEEIKRVAD